MRVTYVNGDLFEGIKTAPKPLLIAHVCNDAGKWGKGFVLPLGRHFPTAKQSYLGEPIRFLGDVQIVVVGEGIYVANMVAQHGFGEACPLRYSALVECMEKVSKCFWAGGIHAPMFGAGLGGGNWEFIETLINEIWCAADIPVTIYRYQKGNDT